MRIVKLSQEEFPTLKDIRDYFEKYLPDTNPLGKIRMTSGRIAQNALELDEVLLFSYKGAICYIARSASGRLKNKDKYRYEYPYYFLVNLDTLHATEISLHYVEQLYHRMTTETKSLVQSQGWPMITNQSFADDLWRILTQASIAEWEALVSRVDESLLNRNLSQPKIRRDALKHLNVLFSVRFPEIKDDPSLLVEYGKTYVKEALAQLKPTGSLNGAEDSIINDLYKTLLSGIEVAQKSSHNDNESFQNLEQFSPEELRISCYDKASDIYNRIRSQTTQNEINMWISGKEPSVTSTKEANMHRISSMSNPKSSNALRIFLCHSSKDKEKVRQLYHRLKADGHSPWLDEEDLIAGQHWQREIPKVVRSSDVVIVCISGNAITQAGYIHKEISFALDVAEEQPDGTIFLIPLRFEDCEMPDRLSHLHWVNFFSDRGYDNLLRALDYRANSAKMH